ncbi:MAG: U32 family peptidase [Chloroflexota bacterium]
MKLLAPVDRVEEVAAVIRAGADELYCGLLTADWHERYIAGSINRRPGGGASFTTLADLAACVDIAHSSNVPVFLAVNEHYYTREQYPFIRDYVEKVAAVGIDALMVADLALLLTLRQMETGIKVIISTGGTAFNSETVRFYQDLGASRVTLPRHLTLDEIGDIRAGAPDVELGVFILNSRCPNVDGFCTFQHGLANKSLKPLFQNACMLPYEVSLGAGGEQSRVSWERQHIWQLVHIDDHPCGACAIYDLAGTGVSSLKIVGRGNPTARKLTDIGFIRSLLEFRENERPTRDEFREVAQQRYRDTYQRPCRGYMCYYPVW